MQIKRAPFKYLYKRVGSRWTARIVAPLAAFLILSCVLLVFMSSAVVDRVLLRAENRALRLAASAEPYARAADAAAMERMFPDLLNGSGLSEDGAILLMIVDADGTVLAHSESVEQGTNCYEGKDGAVYQALLSDAARTGSSARKPALRSVAYAAAALSGGWYAVCAYGFAGTTWLLLILCVFCALAVVFFLLAVLDVMRYLANPLYIPAPPREPARRGDPPPSAARSSRPAPGRSEPPPRQTAPASKSAARPEPPQAVPMMPHRGKTAQPTFPEQQAAVDAAPVNRAKPWNAHPAPSAPKGGKPPAGAPAAPQNAAPPAGEPAVQTGVEPSAKPKADSVAMAAFYKQIAKAAQNMDSTVLSEAFERMNDYQIPESDEKLYADLKGAYDIFEYGMILSLLEENGKIGHA